MIGKFISLFFVWLIGRITQAFRMLWFFVIRFYNGCSKICQAVGELYFTVLPLDLDQLE